MHYRKNVMMCLSLIAVSLGATGTLVTCRVGPDYARPSLDIPPAYTSTQSATTQSATEPSAGIPAQWWQLFEDPDLNTFEEAALRDNPDLQSAMARVARARAVARQVKSQFYPQITFDPSINVAFAPGKDVGSATRIPFDLSYEIDLWGQVARSLEAARANTRATAQQFAVVLQTLEADVAQDYMNLRALEDQSRILSENVKLTREQLDLTKRKVQAGISGNIDVAQAQTQLDSLITQQIDLERQRADAQHALAILVGKPPEDHRGVTIHGAINLVLLGEQFSKAVVSAGDFVDRRRIGIFTGQFDNLAQRVVTVLQTFHRAINRGFQFHRNGHKIDDGAPKRVVGVVMVNASAFAFGNQRAQLIVGISLIRAAGVGDLRHKCAIPVTCNLIAAGRGRGNARYTI